MAMTWKPVSARVTVTTKGTRVQLSATSILTPEIIMQSASANTGRVVVGGVDVVGDPQSSEKGVVLMSAGAAIAASAMYPQQTRLFDLSDWYADASANSSVVLVTYYVQG